MADRHIPLSQIAKNPSVAAFLARGETDDGQEPVAVAPRHPSSPYSGQVKAIIAQAHDDAENDISKRIDRAVKELAAAMTEMHGGKWNAKVNHDRCHVLIARQMSPVA